MLRVQSNTDVKGFTEYEEDILFDEDDPDFDNNNVTASIPFVFKVKCKPGKLLWSLSLFSFGTIDYYSPFNEKSNKLNRYWVRQTVPEVLAEADGLFTSEKYLEVYELLNRLKFKGEAEVQWRICRALFKMSCDRRMVTAKTVRKEMIQEAYDLISDALGLDDQNPNVHKWMAIITDLRCGLDGTVARVKSLSTVKTHLIRAFELNPSDVSVPYMLGKWCFEMSNFSWFQRAVSAILFGKPPESTYEEAYSYFWQAEQIKPRFYLPNLYMLGRTSFYMKQYFRARYYFNIAANLTPRTSYERQCAQKAHILANDLQRFDVAKDALFYGIADENV